MLAFSTNGAIIVVASISVSATTTTSSITAPFVLVP
jgi:hypothetical protein